MRMLCNIYEPTCGCIEINGRNVRRFRDDVQPIIGYLPQHFGLYQHMSVWDYLSYFALLNEIFDTGERKALVEKVIREVHLEDRKHDKIASLSGGMKQRVGIAQTLLHLRARPDEAILCFRSQKPGKRSPNSARQLWTSLTMLR